MASKDGHSAQLIDDVRPHQVFDHEHKDFIENASPDIEYLYSFIKQYDFYAVIRMIETKHQMRFGDTKTPDSDPILLGQTVHMHFAPSTIDKLRTPNPGIQTPKIKNWLDVFFFGLSGPNGPLPAHLTERIFKQIKEQRDTTTIDFLNIFHHRLISLYYRAWANKEPIIQYDLNQKNAFQTYIGSLAGYGLPELQNRDSVSDNIKLKFASFFGRKVKHKDGLIKLIESVFNIKAELQEFSGEWINIPKQHRCILTDHYYAKKLGITSTLGKTSWQCQYKFKLILGPLNLKAYENFLPNSAKSKELNDIIRNYVGIGYTWEIVLRLKKNDTPSTKLSRYGHLGWTSWLQTTNNLSNQRYNKKHKEQAKHWVKGNPNRHNEFYTAKPPSLHQPFSLETTRGARIHSIQKE